MSYYFNEFRFKFYVYNTITSALDYDNNSNSNNSKVENSNKNIELKTYENKTNISNSIKNNKTLIEFDDSNKMNIQKILDNNIKNQHIISNTEALDLNKCNDDFELLKKKQFNELVQQLNLNITDAIDLNNNFLKARRREFVLNNFRNELESIHSESTENYIKFLFKQYLCCYKLNLKENYIYDKALSFQKNIQSSYKYSMEEI